MKPENTLEELIHEATDLLDTMELLLASLNKACHALERKAECETELVELELIEKRDRGFEERARLPESSDS